MQRERTRVEERLQTIRETERELQEAMADFEKRMDAEAALRDKGMFFKTFSKLSELFNCFPSFFKDFLWFLKDFLHCFHS